MINRREFLGMAAAAATAAGGEYRNRQSGLTYRRLGRTGYMIYPVGMGGNPVTPENCDHVKLALDMGLNYLDIAAIYHDGRGEMGYAQVMKTYKRDRFFLNTKVSLWDLNRNKLYKEIFDSLPAPEQTKLRGEAREEIERRQAFAADYFCGYFPGQREELEAASLSNVMSRRYGRKIDREKNYKKLILDSIEGSLKRLETDHLDLMMCPHGANTPYEVLNHPEIFEAFEILKKQGKVRHLAVSAHTDPGGVLEAAVQARHYSAAMVAYNIVNHRYVDAAIEKARQADVGVLAMKVARAVYQGRDIGISDTPARTKLVHDAVPGPLKVPQKAYVWALRNSRVSAVISEMEHSAHVKDNVPLAVTV